MPQPNVVDGSAVTWGRSCMQSIVCVCVNALIQKINKEKYSWDFFPGLAWLFHFQHVKPLLKGDDGILIDLEQLVYEKHMQRILEMLCASAYS